MCIRYIRMGDIVMQVLDRNKILEFMGKRKDALYSQLTRDFTGGMQSRTFEHSEVKFWKEAIERGEFDVWLPEVYVILSKTHPEIVDFTFYTDKEAAEARVNALNEVTKSDEYWYITMFSNSKNSEKCEKEVPKNL